MINLTDLFESISIKNVVNYLIMNKMKNILVSEDSLYTHKNLTIFLIRGEDELSRDYLTLEEAMQQKKITLHETGSVGELLVDNISSDYVFIMAGDIVKGGRQDRTISEDIVLNTGVKKTPLKSFCVEHSRWGARRGESEDYFSSSEKMLNNRALKMAARTEKSQYKVWEEVSCYQKRTGAKLNADVTGCVSPTSLQLTLENEKIKSSISEYADTLQSAFEDKNDVLGFAFFINGKISTIETFGNAALFKKLQKKLLEAAASEAFEQYDENLKFEKPDLKILKDFIEMAENGKETSRMTSANMMEYTKKTDSSIMIRSINTDAGKAALHTSIYSTDVSVDGKDEYVHGGVRLRRNIINTILSMALMINFSACGNRSDKATESMPNIENAEYLTIDCALMDDITEIVEIEIVDDLLLSLGENQLALARAVESIIDHTIFYDPSYVRIPYPMGDVDPKTGVCTDVVIRAYRKTGIDLQKEVHEDMKVNFDNYPKRWGATEPDTHIDHRRVPNLMKFFERHGAVLPITDNEKDYEPGHIVCWDLGSGILHIGIVSCTKACSEINNRLITADRYKVVHNIGRGQVAEDCLFNWKIIGHYKYLVERKE